MERKQEGRIRERGREGDVIFSEALRLLCPYAFIKLQSDVVDLNTHRHTNYRGRREFVILYGTFELTNDNVQPVLIFHLANSAMLFTSLFLC